MAQAGNSLLEKRGIVGIHHGLDGEYIRMPGESLHRAIDHGLPADRAVLLWPARAGAQSAPGCDKDGCGTLGLRHFEPMTDESGMREGSDRIAAHSP